MSRQNMINQILEERDKKAAQEEQQRLIDEQIQAQIIDHNIKDIVHKAYLAYFGRPPTPTEFSGWQAHLKLTGGDPTQMLDTLGHSMEFLVQYRGLDMAWALHQAYGTILGRAPAPAESQFWLDALARGQVEAIAIPWLIATRASGVDAAVFGQRVLFSQQATDLFDTIVAATSAPERVVLEVERALVQDITSPTASVVNTLFKIETNVQTTLQEQILPAPRIALSPDSDDGTKGDNITSQLFVKLNVTTLPGALAWIEKGGTVGQFDPDQDIPVINGVATVKLENETNPFTVYQSVGGHTSHAGSIFIYRWANDVTVEPGKIAALVGNTLSLEFNQPVDWAKLDRNKDGRLDIGLPGSSTNDAGNATELQIDWGSKGGLALLNLYALSAPVPPYGSNFLTITGLEITDTDPGTNDSLSVLLVGIPDQASGITNNVLFKDIS